MTDEGVPRDGGKQYSDSGAEKLKAEGNAFFAGKDLRLVVVAW